MSDAVGPDARTLAQLEAAAAEAHAYLDVLYEAVFEGAFYPGGTWVLPAIAEVAEGLPTFFADPDAYPTDGRGATYSMAYFSAKHIGVGQYYLMAIRDKDGRPLDGSAAYRLRVPPKAPVRLYWSATAYDRMTHALIRDTPRSSRTSNSAGIKANTDGAVDLWFGPAAPEGQADNWIPTPAGRAFEVLVRIYGPEPEFFAKTWVLPDIEKVG